MMILQLIMLSPDSITFQKELDTVLPSLVASASGVVVELGPGSGNQCCRYDKSKVTKVCPYFFLSLSPSPFSLHAASGTPIPSLIFPRKT